MMGVERRGGRGLHRFAILTGAATFFLIVVGSLVTSTDSGLAVPDWPLSYGMLFPPMVGGIFYEHGHRMVAGAVGMLTVGLGIWLGLRENRLWLRWLGTIAVCTILLQAVLGGITVLWLLPPVVSVAHAGLAAAFFCLVSCIALFTSDAWRREKDTNGHPTVQKPAPPLRRIAIVTALAGYLQLLLGASMRHLGAGLACLDFPFCNGEVVPTIRSIGLGLHFSHRVWALVVFALVVRLCMVANRDHRGCRELMAPSRTVLVVAVFQIILGAWTVLSGLAVGPLTAHVAGGSLLVMTLVLLTAQTYRFGARQVTGVAASAGVATT